MGCLSDRPPCFARDVREGREYRPGQRPPTATLSFPLSCGEGASNMPEPSSETSEESLATKEAEPSEAEPKNPKQKTLKHRRRRCSRRRHSDGFDSFAAYFPRVLKQVHEGLSLSQEAVNVMDSFVKDIFEQTANEAARLVRSSKRSTLSSREIQTSVRLLLPGDMGKHAVSNASKAVIRHPTGK
ncbi:PREDICTED: histone H2B type W-T-like [Lipotes vexillifer]|uniref:Histone H2B type W-T-like n=1 Tax=Lipotes vexillifer TaxID=118797 RepID=A0A340Y8Y2_LIPVE|nr:PREDICTED: histone H2B type W-T-like [Lipotes vexillifer]